MLGEAALSTWLEKNLSTRGEQGVSRTLLHGAGREIAAGICRESCPGWGVGWRAKPGRQPGGGGHAPRPQPPKSVEAAAFSPGLSPDEESCFFLPSSPPPRGVGVGAKHAWHSSAGAAWGEGPSKSPQTQPSDPVKPAGGQYLSSSPPASAGPVSGIVGGSGTAGGQDWLLPPWPPWEVGSSLLHGATKTPATLPSAPGPSLPCPMVKRQRPPFCVDGKPLGPHPSLPS